jgi:hypothetical protein
MRARRSTKRLPVARRTGAAATMEAIDAEREALAAATG